MPFLGLSIYRRSTHSVHPAAQQVPISSEKSSMRESFVLARVDSVVSVSGEATKQRVLRICSRRHSVEAITRASARVNDTDNQCLHKRIPSLYSSRHR